MNTEETDMKTAEETLIENLYPYEASNYFKPAILKAMKAYAKAAIEEDRKDAAEATMEVLHDEGIYGFGPQVKEGITDRPLPDLR